MAGKAVTRHLTYAWIEYGDPLDGQAFTDGLYDMGWKNALSGFPVKKADAFGVRAVDASHPLLPLRWRGRALMILPNERIDEHDLDGRPNPPLKDPIFEDFKKANGEDSFKDEIRKQNRFIASWVFSPGINKVSDSESNLTTGGDITDFADLVAISGHGTGGNVWGGGEQARLAEALESPIAAASDRLKYVIIPSCSNVNGTISEAWLPAFRRERPVHGILGYEVGYPGNATGAAIFQKFINNLKAGGGASNTILKAWRAAHAGDKSTSNIWAAVLHESSAASDTMEKWLSDKLDAPDKNGDVRWYDETHPDGVVLKETIPDYTVNYYMGSTKISATNTSHDDVGLFQGQKGAIGIAKTNGTFEVGDTFTIKFYIFRFDHPGMNVDTLLAFDPAPDVDMTLLKDQNRSIPRVGAVDAVKIVFKNGGLKETKLPFTVRKDALKNYALAGGNFHGYFLLEIIPADDISNSKIFSLDGAYLREP